MYAFELRDVGMSNKADVILQTYLKAEKEECPSDRGCEFWLLLQFEYGLG